MNDMTPVITPKSDQISADDLISGPMTVTIKDVKISPGTEQPVSIVLEETDRLFRPCKSMSRVMVYGWGPDAKLYIGRSLTLYRDPEVKWGGMAVGGIRISHMSHIDGAQTMVLAVTKGSRKPYKVAPLVVEQSKPAATTDTAATWTRQNIAKLAGLATPTDLGAFVDSKAAKIAELAEKRPELHKEFTAAIDARASALGQADPFADDDDTPNPAKAKADEILADLAKVETVDDLDTLAASSEPHVAAMDDADAETVRGQFEKARERLSVPA